MSSRDQNKSGTIVNRIYFTNWNRTQDCSKLYEEWLGKEPLFNSLLLNGHLIVGKVEGTNEIIAAAQLILNEDNIRNRRWGLVENVYVLKEYRRKGIGSSLMRCVETQASSLGCDFIKLTSRKLEGIELYRFLGYEEGLSFRKELKWGGIQE